MKEEKTYMVPHDSKSITIANPDFLQSGEYYSPAHQNLRRCLYWMAMYLKQEIDMPESWHNNGERPETSDTVIADGSGVSIVRVSHHKFPSGPGKTPWKEQWKYFPAIDDELKTKKKGGK